MTKVFSRTILILTTPYWGIEVNYFFMKQTIDDKSDIIRRLKIIEGHIKKVISMVENDRYCVDVLQQSSAVRSALKKTQDLILTRHLKGCVHHALKEERGEKVVKELIDIYTQSK